MSEKKCRFCGESLSRSFVDLGMSPLSNAYISESELQNKENFYPLHVYVCEKCLLVQLEKFESPEKIFGEYAYFSSFSDSWLEHMKTYVDLALENYDLNNDSLVVEIASNDGYLLQYFKEAAITVLGVEPAVNVAKVAQQKGIDTIVDFFGTRLAGQMVQQGKMADLLIGNNVLAHVPDLNDFIEGIKLILKPAGVITMEFPHLLKLIQMNQFDTIYHEHFSYFSFHTVQAVFIAHGLKIFNVEQLVTHGGSLRIYACHSENTDRNICSGVKTLLDEEAAVGLKDIETYTKFSEKVKETKRKLLSFMIDIKQNNKVIAAYGAPAKGNTLLNYCGIGNDFIEYTVDRNPYKRGLYLPGTHIPILSPDIIIEKKPDYLLILPWNLKDEIMEQMSVIREWDGKFIVPIPRVEVL